MSIMDFFASQGTAVPSTGSSGGDWKDWFLDIEGRGPFGRRTINPEEDAERGDWIDWFLNREGPAGRFKGSKRPKHGIRYMFDDGGYAQSGPKKRQKLQPRSADVLGNLSNRYYKERNLEGMRRIGHEMQDRLDNHPATQPGTGSLLPNMQEPWNNPGPGSWWNVSLPSGGNNSGIMAAAVADNRPDFQGNWLINSDWGNRLLGLLANRHGDEETQGKLREIIGGGGIDLWGGKLKPTWGDDRYGLNWEIGLGG